jgi:hypothetical protein
MEEMRGHAETLRAAGHTVTSRWVYGSETERGEDQSESTAVRASKMDIADVLEAETILFFGEPRGSSNRGGGRWFELGLAYASGLRCICVLNMNDEAVHDHNESGHESVFTHIFECYQSFEEAMVAL